MRMQQEREMQTLSQRTATHIRTRIHKHAETHVPRPVQTVRQLADARPRTHHILQEEKRNKASTSKGTGKNSQHLTSYRYHGGTEIRPLRRNVRHV